MKIENDRSRIKINDPSTDDNLTSLQGYVRATYQELVDKLGEPHNVIIDKSNASWTLESSDGTVATIYDWKNSTLPREEYDWHIGGFGRSALVLVAFFLTKSVTGVKLPAGKHRKHS
jgi:hypothetical protein